MAVMLTWGVLLFWAWPAAAPPMFLHRSVSRERVVGRQPTPPFMRTDADAGKFAFLIPRISRAYASEWGAGGHVCATAVRSGSTTVRCASVRLREYLPGL
jgi:hypothetical protein